MTGNTTAVVRALNGLEVNLSFRKHVGPRYMHGAVVLRFEAAETYSFESKAVWPDWGNYLRRKLGSLPGMRVSLTRVSWHYVDSSEQGFRRAATGAIAAALDLERA